MFASALRIAFQYILLVVGGVALPTLPVAAQALAVEGAFELDDEPNISGIDCAGVPGDTERLCVVVDDELKKAQFASLFADRLVAGEAIALFAASNAPIVGQEPSAENIACSKGRDPGEMDGEGIARDQSVFYVMGSHGCSAKGKYRPQTFVLARVNLSPDGAPTVERTYRLSEALLAAPEVRQHFARDLDNGGISFEGIAARDGRLLLAARVPSVDMDGVGNAVLVSVDANALFASEGAIPPATVTFVPLGKDRGFRDFEALADGRYLALTGPTADGDGAFQLQLLGSDLKPQGNPASVVRPDGAEGSPEAVEWIGDKEGQHQVLILSDGAPNGGPFVVSFKE